MISRNKIRTLGAPVAGPGSSMMLGLEKSIREQIHLSGPLDMAGVDYDIRINKYGCLYYKANERTRLRTIVQALEEKI